jgi:hypothetical protein
MMTEARGCAPNKSPHSVFPIDSGDDELDTPAPVTPEFAEFMALPSAALFRIVSATQDI